MNFMGHSILIGLGVADVWCEPVAATLEVPLEAAEKLRMTMVSRGDHIRGEAATTNLY